VSWTDFLPGGLRRRVETGVGARAVLSNITWLSFDRVVRMGVGLVVGVWVARFLGPGDYGLLSFSLAFASLLGPIAFLGLDSIVVRELVRSPDRREELVGTAFGLKAAGGVVAIVLSVVLAALLRPGDNLTLVLVAIAATIFLVQSFDAIDFWFQSRVESRYTVYAKNAAFIIASVFRVILIAVGATVVAFGWAGLLEAMIASLGLLLVYWKRGGQFAAWRLDFTTARTLLTASWPLLLAGLSVAIYMRIDQVMLGYMMDDVAVGTYSAASKVVEVWYFIPGSIAASVFPALVKARETGEGVYKKRLQLFYDSISSIGLIISALVSLGSGFLITLLYGDQYQGAIPILTIYAWASVPVFLGVATGQYLVLENKIDVLLYRTLLGGATNVALNIVLIPPLGGVGAAVATLVSQCVVTFSLLFFHGGGGQARAILDSLNPVRLVRNTVRVLKA